MILFEISIVDIHKIGVNYKPIKKYYILYIIYS